MPPPFFSIITATFNAEKTLPRLLDSLSLQTCRDFNWIMQDGGSQDHTVEIAESYRGRLPEILLESARDEGIYEAWNKALDRVGEGLGTWVLFLGADDLLAADDVLEKIKSVLLKQADTVLYGAGNIYMFNDRTGFFKIQKVNIPQCWAGRKDGMSIPHPSLFHSKQLFINHRFTTKYTLAGDYDFIVRTLRSEFSIIHIDTIVTKMSMLGKSGTDRVLVAAENAAVRREHFLCYYYLKKIKDAGFSAKMSIKKMCCTTNCGKLFWNHLSKCKGRFFKNAK